MLKVGIIGAGGYAGETLVGILLRHPEVEIAYVMSEDAHVGKKLSDLYPHLLDETDLVVEKTQARKADMVFLALPHGVSQNYVPELLELGAKVIDLGADYRFADEEFYQKWYKEPHKTPKLLKEAVFGLPELYREQIKKARLVGNPGCYPTASILGIAPLVKNKLIELDSVVVDAKSGISGAGRGVSLKTHFCERNDGIEAYAVTNHRHMGEIEYQVIRISGEPAARVTFVPHLTPMSRGILATIYGKLKTHPDSIGTKLKTNELNQLYKDFYKGEPFVRILGDKLPNTKYVVGTNYCDIAVEVNEITGTVIVLSVVDNLVKGAAGQAVENMNIMCGFEETAGLKQIALFP